MIWSALLGAAIWDMGRGTIRVTRVPRPGAEAEVMGPYFPVTAYETKQGFEARGCAAARASRPRLRLTVAPRRVRAGRRTRFTFRVRASGRPVRGATVRLGTLIGQVSVAVTASTGQVTVELSTPGTDEPSESTNSLPEST